MVKKNIPKKGKGKKKSVKGRSNLPVSGISDGLYTAYTTQKAEKEIENKDEVPKKSVQKNETRQLIWFFVIILIIFASFLIPYFYTQKSKTFNYAGAKWAVEKVPGAIKIIYHGRFPALNGANYMYNLFLINDPRKNNVSVEGKFKSFRAGGYVSISPEANKCRGEVSRVMADLGSFLRFAIGVKKLQVATPDFKVHNQTGRAYATCDTQGRTIIMIEKGNSSVEESKTNPFCYTIKVKDCNDIAPVEKFMTEVIKTARGKN